MKRKILVIEDDKAIALALSVRLMANDYNVLSAHDAVTGLQTALRDRPDLIVLDICLPGGGGLVTAEWLRNSGLTEGIPFIVVTASKKPGLRERAEELGAVGFFQKPYEAQELLDAIRAVVG